MRNLATIAVALVLLSAPDLLAQGPHRYQKGGPPFERIEAYKKVRMMDAMKLNEGLMVKFMARYDKHVEEMQGLELQRNDLVDRLEQFVNADDPNADFNPLFDSLITVNRKLSESRVGFLSELKDILSDRQIAEYVVFERNFSRELRRIVQNLRLGGGRAH